MTEEPLTVSKEPPPRVEGLELVKLAVEAWKKTVDVQQHFNDLELRVRNFAMTFAAAVLGLVAGFALKEGTPSFLPTALGAIGAVAWVAFYLMDRHWYHRFLESAVDHGRAIEAWLRVSTRSDIFSLATGIKEASGIEVVPKRKLRSGHRIDLFYGGFALAFAGLVLLFHAAAPNTASAPSGSPTSASPASATPPSSPLVAMPAGNSGPSTGHATGDAGGSMQGTSADGGIRPAGTQGDAGPPPRPGP